MRVKPKNTFRVDRGPALARPAAPAAWSVAPGVVDGTIAITFTTLGAAGDGSVFGDGLGTITDLEYNYEGFATWRPVASTSQTGPGTFVVGWRLIPGEEVVVRVRQRGTGRRAGAPSDYRGVIVPGAEAYMAGILMEDGSLLMQDGKPVVQMRQRTVALPGVAIEPSARILYVGDNAAQDVSALFSGQNLTFSATGLPPGRTINATTGVISGTHSTVGNTTATISATNAGGMISVDLTTQVLAAKWVVPWVSTNGARLNYATGFGSDSPQMTFRARYRKLDGILAAQARFAQSTGGIEIQMTSIGKLRVFLHKGASNDYAVSWLSAETFRLSGDVIIDVVADLGATPTFRVWVNNVEIAGAFNVGPLTASIRFNRPGYGIGSVHDSAGDLYNGDVAYVYLEMGAARLPAEFVDALGNDLDIKTVGAPQILFVGTPAEWTAGTNFGTGPNFTATGAYAAPGAGTALSLLAEPGAEGFGRFAVGGRSLDAHIYKVTVLDDSATTVGAFRWAVAQPAPRIILLMKEGDIRHANEVPIFGDTSIFDVAPGNGCRLVGSRVHLCYSNIVMRHVTILPGNLSPGQGLTVRDCLTIGDGDGTKGGAVSNIYISELTCARATDEIISFWNGRSAARKISNVSVTKTLVTQGLFNSGHTDMPENGDHSMAMLIGQYCEKISIFGNDLSNCRYRHPQIQENCYEIEFISNLVSNWAGNGTEASNTTQSLHLENNLYAYGPNTAVYNDLIGPFDPVTQVGRNNPGSARPINLRSHTSPTVKMTGNILDYGATETTVQANMVNYVSSGSPGAEITTSNIFTPSGITSILAADIRAFIAANCGAKKNGGGRIAFTQAIIDGDVAGTSTIVAAGGEPYVADAGTADLTDTDGDGVPDAYWTAVGTTRAATAVIASGPYQGFLEVERYVDWRKGKSTGL